MSFPLAPFARRIGVESGRKIPANYTATDGSAVFVLGSDQPGKTAHVNIPGLTTIGDYLEVMQQGDLLTGTPVNFVRARVFLRAPTSLPKGIIWRFGARVDTDGLVGDTLGRVSVNDINQDISLLDLAIPVRGQVVGTNSAIAFRLDVATEGGGLSGSLLAISGYSAITFTVDTTLDLINATAHGLVDGEQVVLKTSGTLPAPFVTNKPYYVINATTNTFRLSLTSGGAAVDITSSGTGTQTASTQEQTLTGLWNQEPASVGRVIKIFGAATGANNGQFVVTKFIADDSVKVRNTLGTSTDANNGTINWEVRHLDVEMPAVYIDSVALDTNVIDRPVTINRSPNPDQTQVPASTAIYFELSDPAVAINQIVLADIRVRINGVLALSGTTPQAGFSGNVSTGIDGNRTVQVTVVPDVPFPPLSVVTVQTEARVINGSTVITNYSFTTADTLAPQLVEAIATEGRSVRVTFNEPVISETAAGAFDALNPDNWAIELLSDSLDNGLPAYSPIVESVAEIAPNIFDLVLNDDVTHGALYRIVPGPIKDLFGNSIIQGLAKARTYPFALDCSPSGAYMSLAYTAARIPGTSFAYAFWVRVKGPLQGGSHSVVLYNEGDYTIGFLLNQFGIDLYVYMNNGGPPTTTFPAFWSSLGFTWHRVVVYTNIPSQTIRVYVDGVLFGSVSGLAMSPINPGVQGSTGIGGASSFGGAANFVFADFCFHNGATITDADVAADYIDDVRMPGLAMRLKLDEGTGTTPFDTAPDGGPTATFVGVPVWTTNAPVILDPHNTVDFTGFVCLPPDGRSFELLDMLPDMNLSEDETRDLEAFVKCFQEVTNVLLCDVDEWTTILDPDAAPESFVDAMLLDLGNPFAFDLGLNDKRRLIRVLVPIYQEKGTEEGIINAIRFFLGIEVTINYPAFTGAWFLGLSELGVGTLLSTADLHTRLSFEIVSPIVLDDSQRDTMIKIAEYMKDARTHLIKPLTEPVVIPPVTDFWIIGQSLLGQDTKLSIGTPALFSGLQLWLASDVGITLVGNDVSQWNDQSGNGRHFTEGSRRPRYLTSAFNGRPCLEFDQGNQEKMEAAALLGDVIQADRFTAFIVFSVAAIDTNDATSWNNDALICSDDGAASSWSISVKSAGAGNSSVLGANFDGTDDFVARGNINLTNQPYLFSYRHDELASTIFAALYPFGEGSIGTGNASPLTGTLRLGANAALTQFLHGRIAEVIIYNRNLTSAELTSVRTYLANKYFIT